MDAVAASRPDVPSDTADPAFEFGFGLRYSDWTPRPQPTDEERASTTLARRRGGRYRLHRTSVGQLLDDPDAQAILVEDLPQLFTHPMLKVSLGMDIDSAVTMVAANMNPDGRRRLVSRLAAL